MSDRAFLSALLIDPTLGLTFLPLADLTGAGAPRRSPASSCLASQAKSGMKNPAKGPVVSRKGSRVSAPV